LLSAINVAIIVVFWNRSHKIGTSTSKLSKKMLIRGWCKTLRSIRPGVKFTNILWAAFLIQKLIGKLYTPWILKFCTFLRKKSAEKMLIKYWWNWLQLCQHTRHALRCREHPGFQISTNNYFKTLDSYKNFLSSFSFNDLAFYNSCLQILVGKLILALRSWCIFKQRKGTFYTKDILKN
jgi:hypothetical protein